MRKNKKIIPYEIITPAVDGDVIAMTYILKHFENYLVHLSRRRLFDGKGNTYMYIDQEIKKRLEMKLTISVLKFKLT